MSILGFFKVFIFDTNRSKLLYSISFIFLTTAGQSIYAHGTVTSPPSRVWNCYQEGPESPDSPACIEAVAVYGTQPLYDWNSILQGNANSNHTTVVPNGTLGSGGNSAKYGGMDQVRTDWVKTPVSAGPFTVTWTNSAPHATAYYDVYITTANWTPDMPLSWDKLLLLIRTDPSPASNSDDIPVTLPARSGHHVIYSVWQRSDSPEAFYSTSDVIFEGVPPPPPETKKVIINDNLDVNQSAIIKKDLTVDSTLRVGSQFIQSTNPELTFQSGTDSKFIMKYENGLDKFTIEEVGSGVAFEIKDGEIYLPQYASETSKALGIDENGKIVDEAISLAAYNKYNFSLIDPFTGYNITKLGVQFANGKVLTGINAYLLDNNLMTGSKNNSITVNIVRRSKTSNAIPDEIIYQIVGEGTASDVFSSFTTNTMITPGSNVIDNDNYIYSIEISYCDDCDFREIRILD